MKILELKDNPNLRTDDSSYKKYLTFKKLLSELKQKKIPDEVLIAINAEVDTVNNTSLENGFVKQLKESQSKIITLVEKELGLTVKNHYQKKWLAIGMAAFGVPIGAALGTVLGNMAFLAIGLPFGMCIGIVVGTTKDNKAKAAGKQLAIEI